MPIGTKSFDEIIKKWELKEGNLKLDEAKKETIFGHFINCFDIEKFSFIKKNRQKGSPNHLRTYDRTLWTQGTSSQNRKIR